MIDQVKIIYESTPSTDDIQRLYDGIASHAQEKKQQPPIETFGFFAKDNHQNMVGGCNGAMFYGCLYIDSLWVNESYRGKSLGTQLVNAAEALGRERGCLFSTVNTMDWEALGFYQRLGYVVEFQRTGYFHQSTFYFLRKSLQQSRFIVRSLTMADIETLYTSFNEHNWLKPKSLFEQYLQEQTQDERKIWLAFDKHALAGYVTLKWRSNYQPFMDNAIPEIMDLNVLPPFRKQGIGSLLLETAEHEARAKSKFVGIGVGLYPDYGHAQKLYIKKGYVPDGRGISYNYKTVEPGSMVCLDDDLVFWFIKRLSV